MRERAVKAGIGAALATLLVPGALALAVVPAPLPAGAQSSLKATQEQVRRQQSDVAGQINTMTADGAAIDAAIRDLDANVLRQQELAHKADNAVIDASRRAAAADSAARAKADEVEVLRRQVASLAVRNYIDPPGGGLMDQMRVESANVAALKQALIGVGAQRTGDLLDLLRAARHELEVQRSEAERAREEAESQKAEAERRQGELTSAKADKQSFANDLEVRLNAKLGEAAALSAVDAQLAAQIRAEQDALVERLRSMAPPTPPPSSGGGDPGDGGQSGGGSPPPVLPDVPLATVRGITVNAQIADRLEAMLAAAAADGISLSGSGYRSSASQVALRRQNCGTSDYAVWNMPVWQCTPPTAKPGTSMHERGLAIDFSGIPQYPGTDNAKYNWLVANAASYGFYNLPSEGWHWSTTGG